MIKKIEQWVIDRNIQTQDPFHGLAKVNEEIGELSRAMLKEDRAQIVDGIGDVFVALVSLSLQLGLKPEFCLLCAYNEIKDRKGKLINGVFVKE